MLLDSLDKVAKEKPELRGQVSQLQTAITELKAPQCALEETPLSGNYKAEIAENQTQTELRCKFNSQPGRVSAK